MRRIVSGRVDVEIAGRSILEGVGVEIHEGDSVAIVGPNGAGKTTLLRVLAGVWKPTRGGFELFGTPYSAISPRDLARSLAYVPQVRPARVPLTVRDVVLLGRYPHKRRWSLGLEAEDFRAAAEALEVVGLGELADRSLADLSGGERQGVYIAAALAQESECLILDEPTTYLDPGHQRRIAHVLQTLIHVEGRTVVFASHDLNLAQALSNTVIALAEGRVVAAGPTRQVLTKPLLGELFNAPFHVHGREGHSVVTVDLRPDESGDERP